MNDIFKETILGALTLKGALWIFHDPAPLEGAPRRVRATVGAFLQPTGQLNLASSVCSEGDNFSRAFGRAAVLGKLEAQLIAGAPHEMVSLSEQELPQVNFLIERIVLTYQVELFRSMLALRGEKLDEAQEHLARCCTHAAVKRKRT